MGGRVSWQARRVPWSATAPQPIQTSFTIDNFVEVVKDAPPAAKPAPAKPLPPKAAAPVPPAKKVVKAKCTFDYTAANADELSIKVQTTGISIILIIKQLGDVLVVTKQDGDEGWWEGELNGAYINSNVTFSIVIRPHRHLSKQLCGAD